MQVLAMIMSFIFGMNKKTKGIREIAVEIFEEVIIKSRKVVTLALTGIAAIIFFCGGIFIALLDSTTQYDRNGFINFTATLGAGLGLILIAALGFAVVFLRAWPGAMRKAEARHHQTHHREASSLEQALSILVMDFVKEREIRRGQRPSPTPPSSSSRPEPPHSHTASSERPSSDPIH